VSFALPTALIVFRLRGAYSAIDNAFVKYEQDHPPQRAA